MIHFMVDFENVRNPGLLGCGYLLPSDCMTIFYSAACSKMESSKMEQIMESGCMLDICRLQKTRKNALDFYIASRVGELFDKGYEGAVVIVSNDKGFLAVQEYWKSHCGRPRVEVKPNVEQGIMASGETSLRRKTIEGKHKLVSLESEFEKYQERRRIRSEIENLFADTEYQSCTDMIMEIVQEKADSKERYLNSLKKFGRKDGCYIYRKLKQVI